VQVRLDLVDRAHEEDAALPARVGRLQHRREADLGRGTPPFRERAQGCEPRLRHTGLGERPPHRHLVGHQVRRLRPEARQPARLRDRGHDRHGPVGGDRQHTVDLLALDRFEHGRHVGEIDHEAAVRDLQPERVGIPVDAEHAQPELLGPQDRAPLVAARTDEQHRLHAPRC
jgi:hypothetical protein